MIVFDYSPNLQKILGKSVKLDGTDYKIVERDWSAFTESGSAGAEPCIHVSVNGVKLHLKPAYWKADKKETTNLKDFSAELKLLELPKDEDAAVREALKTKKIEHYNFTEKVRREVLYRLIAARAADKSYDPQDAYLLLQKTFMCPSTMEKKIYSLFTGKEYTGNKADILQIDESMVCALLYALSLNEYDVPPVYSDKKAPEVFGWSGLAPGEIKKLYQDVIRELLPKPKAGKDAPPAKKAKGKKT